MHCVQQGADELFARLVARYQARLMRVAHSRLGRHDWAEDVVQETLLAAFKSRGSFKTDGSFRTWLWTILLNQCRRHYRRRQRTPRVEGWPQTPPELDERQSELSPVSLDASPPAQLIERERIDLLETLLSQLSESQADALRLRFFAGLKFREIAETMQCSLATAKNRVRQGLLKMSELLDEQTCSAAELLEKKA